MAEEGIDTGATQRVPLTEMPVMQPSPRRSTPPQQPQQPERKQPPRKKKPGMSKKDRVTVITLFSIAGILLIGIIIALSFLLQGPADNELILNNVYVAGVNVGGMTKAQAKQALRNVERDYSQLDMVVQVLDTKVSLSPAGTGAKLDVDAAVEAAYNLGRTGTKSEQDKAQNASSHNVSVLPYLNLNQGYIEEAVNAIGQKYGTLRTDPVITIEGNSPVGGSVDVTDTETVYQTMYIYMGTAQYDFSTAALYNQIMSAYDSGIFEVEGQCSVTPPKLSVMDELERVFKAHCTKPSNATIDDYFNVTAEVYGYGIVLEDVKDLVASAKYGETLEIPMTFIRPDVTAEDLAGNLFKDVLGSYVLDVQPDVNLIANLKLVCKALNEHLLMSGDTFSFNTLIGETTRQRGYKPFSQYIDTVYTESVYGGGISQAASALYVCALLADIDILERHSHSYAPDFIAPGLDADVRYGVKDFRFENSTDYPIRIYAEYKNGQLIIQLVGTDTKDYTVELKLVTDKTYDPVTLLQTMPFNNSGNYKNGDILQTAITGYDVSVYKVCTPKPVEPEEGEGTEPGEGEEELPSEPTEPTVPSEPSDPTDPTDPIDPNDPNAPVNPEDQIPVDEVFVGQTHYEKRNIIMISIVDPNENPSEPTEPSIPGESTEEVTEPSVPVFG